MASAVSLPMGATGGFKSVTECWRLSAQLCTALGAALVDDVASSFGSHTCAEAVTVLTNAVRWLERALHSGVLWFLGQTHKWIRSRSTIQTCPLERAWRGVNAQGGVKLQHFSNFRERNCYSDHETYAELTRQGPKSSMRRERGMTFHCSSPSRVQQIASAQER